MYKILKIEPDSTKIFLLLIPPFYCIWLFKLGKTLLIQQKKNSLVYSIISILTIIFFITTTILPFIVFYLGLNINPKENGTEPIIITTLILWISTLIMLTKIIIDVKKQSTNKKNIKLIDYIKFFFELVFWWYNIRNLQKNIQKEYIKI